MLGYNKLIEKSGSVITKIGYQNKNSITEYTSLWHRRKNCNVMSNQYQELLEQL